MNYFFRKKTAYFTHFIYFVLVDIWADMLSAIERFESGYGTGIWRVFFFCFYIFWQLKF